MVVVKVLESPPGSSFQYLDFKKGMIYTQMLQEAADKAAIQRVKVPS
jgi:hypothetical protein